MNDLTGTRTLVGFTVRRDRLRIVLWVLGIFLLAYVGAASTKGLYKTQADLDEAAQVSQDSPAAIAFNGPAQALDTMGGQVAFQIGATTLAAVGLMTLLLTARWTRGEEESGRLELVRAMPVGRHAPMAAALTVVIAMNVVLAALVAGSLAALDLPVAGSIAMGLSFLAIGIVFAGIAAVTTQVSENNRVAGGLAGAVLAAAFVIRAVGDIGNGAASWLSPIGWSQKLRPYAGEAWWALLVPLVATAALAVLARRLASRRDFGSGLVPPRPGPATASSRLGSVLGVTVRLDRGTALWWSVAVVVMGATYGSLTKAIDDFVSDNEALQDLIARSGAASLREAYLGTSMLIVSLIAAGYAVQSIVRPRSEESSMRAEAVLATPVSRWRWLGTQLGVTAAGSVAVLTAGALGTGIAAAAVTGDAALVPRMLGAGLAYLPAMWALLAVGIALHGLAPRNVVVLWVVLGACFVIGFFKELLHIPQWLADVSPFEHTPLLPAVGFDPVPLLLLTVVAVALAWAGLAGFRHRDISS